MSFRPLSFALPLLLVGLPWTVAYGQSTPVSSTAPLDEFRSFCLGPRLEPAEFARLAEASGFQPTPPRNPGLPVQIRTWVKSDLNAFRYLSEGSASTKVNGVLAIKRACMMLVEPSDPLAADGVRADWVLPTPKNRLGRHEFVFRSGAAARRPIGPEDQEAAEAAFKAGQLGQLVIDEQPGRTILSLEHLTPAAVALPKEAPAAPLGGSDLELVSSEFQTLCLAGRPDLSRLTTAAEADRWQPYPQAVATNLIRTFKGKSMYGWTKSSKVAMRQLVYAEAEKRVFNKVHFGKECALLVYGDIPLERLADLTGLPTSKGHATHWLVRVHDGRRELLSDRGRPADEAERVGELAEITFERDGAATILSYVALSSVN